MSDLELLEKILESSSIELNMNDVFAWGCAESVEVPFSDLKELLPLHQEYGDVVHIAYCAIKTDQLPMNYITHCPDLMKDYAIVENEIRKMCNQGKLELAADLKRRQEEIDTYGSQIEWRREFPSRWEDLVYAVRRYFGRDRWRTQKIRGTLESGISAVGTCQRDVMDELLTKLTYRRINGE